MQQDLFAVRAVFSHVLRALLAQPHAVTETIRGQNRVVFFKGNRKTLQLPRRSFSLGSSNIHLCPARVPQKSKNSAPVLFPPSEEIWRAFTPPAPPSNIFSRKFACRLPPTGDGTVLLIFTYHRLEKEEKRRYTYSRKR